MAGETILLSNQEAKHTPSKLITIKDVQEIQPQGKVDQGDIRKRKQQASSALERSKLHQEISELQQKKTMMLGNLRQSINQEKENWITEKEDERKKAQESGYQAGYETGTKEARMDWQESLNAVNELTDQAKEDYFRTVDKHEETIIQLAIASAEKIIHHELQINKDLMLTIINEAMTELYNEAYIHIYIHPEAYELVVKQKPELEQIVGTKDLISIYVDAELQKNDCIIKHPNGQIDAGLDSQLRQIKNALFEKVMEES